MTAPPIRLLLLEDNPGDAILVREALAEEAPGEFAVTTAERLADAQMRLQNERFDAVLCDLGLPDSAGLATAKEIIAKAPGVPLVVLTGTHDVQLGRKAIDLGAQDYMVKGDTKPSLARTIRYAIDRKRLENDLRTLNEALEQRVAERTAELKRKNETLKQEGDWNRALLRNASDGVHVLDANGDVLEASDSFCAMLGYSREQIIGANVSLWDVRRTPKELKENVAEQLAATGPTQFQTRHRRKDGSTFEVEVSSQGLALEGRPVLFNSARDITERRRAEQHVRESSIRIEQAMLGTIGAVSRMMALRDPYTSGHSRRVGELSAEIAAEMGFGADMQRGLRVAGGLHDVGKITIPAEILSRPGKLSEIEYRLIQDHAQQGYEVLKDIDFPWPVADAARQHHERMDGSGYPRGLKDNEIILEARILSVADVVEAMCSHRPYRPGLGIDKALAEVERGRGTAYDANAVDACVRLFREKGYAIPA